MDIINKRSEARKKWWAKQTPEQRKSHGSKMAKSKHAQKTKAERSEFARMMALKRWNKN